MRMTRRWCALALTQVVLALTAATGYGAVPQIKDYSYFLEQTVDLDRLMVLDQGIQCKQFSSYDRDSRYDEATGQYVKWDANGDSGHYMRVDKATGEAVMAEIEGPGCIWRIWSADPKGKIRFYLDGAEQPTYEFDFDGLFSGKTDGFPRPLVWQRRLVLGGDNPAADCYVPIPFAKGCKVTADKAQRQYYHIGYTTFPKDWKFKTFSQRRTAEEEAALQRVCKLQAACGDDPQPVAGAETAEKNVTLAPGQAEVLAELKGPATIRQFLAKLVSDERWARRKVLLQMFWDGAQNPSVEAPIGDFFGDAWDEATYQSLPMGITDQLNYCYWRMPFAKSARIVATNQGQQPAQLRWKLVYKPGELPDNVGYFHARWRRDRTSKEFDYPMLECTGHGRFVGVVLFPDNIAGGWWGEGDEKVYVDGEKFPSTFGTGSEDYFGDAWGIRRFVNPFHGCPSRREPNEGRHQSVYRWHVGDNIPFAQSFKITIENYSAIANEPLRNDYSSMAYWYQASGGSDFFSSVPAKERIPQGPVYAGAVEAENMVSATALPDGVAVVSDDNLPEQLSNEKGLKISGKPGSAVKLALPAPADGSFSIEAITAKGVKASKFELLKDGKPIGERLRLTKGDNQIEVRLAGEPVKGDTCEVILDCVVLKPYQHYVRAWQLIGPFDNQGGAGFNAVYGPEQEPFASTKAYPGQGGEARWRKIKVPDGQLTSAGDYFKNNDQIILYVYCEIVSPDARKATAYVGSDDGVKVWVNGEVVHSKNVQRGLQPDQDRFEISLKAGRNPVLVKVANGRGPWGLTFRVDAPDEQLEYELPQ